MKVINNTNQIKYLPIRNVALMPGENDVDEKAFNENREQPGLEQDIESGRVVIKDGNSPKKKEKKEEPEFIPDPDTDYPVKTSENSPWYRLSNGEKILGENNAYEKQEAIDAGEELDG